MSLKLRAVSDSDPTSALRFRHHDEVQLVPHPGVHDQASPIFRVATGLPDRLAGACCRSCHRQTGIQAVTMQLAILPSPPAAGAFEMTCGVSDAGAADAVVADSVARAKTKAAPTVSVRRMTFFDQSICVFIRIPCTPLRRTVALGAAHVAAADKRINHPVTSDESHPESRHDSCEVHPKGFLQLRIVGLRPCGHGGRGSGGGPSPTAALQLGQVARRTRLGQASGLRRSGTGGAGARVRGWRTRSPAMGPVCTGVRPLRRAVMS